MVAMGNWWTVIEIRPVSGAPVAADFKSVLTFHPNIEVHNDADPVAYKADREAVERAVTIMDVKIPQPIDEA